MMTRGSEGELWCHYAQVGRLLLSRQQKFHSLADIRLQSLTRGPVIAVAIWGNLEKAQENPRKPKKHPQLLAPRFNGHWMASPEPSSWSKAGMCILLQLAEEFVISVQFPSQL
jgi:hypothetical protein